MSKGNTCPICESDRLEAFLNRERVPVHQNLIIKSPEAAQETPHGDLNLNVCKTCGFVFNIDFEPSKLSYGERYDNSQESSPSFNQYLDELAHYLIFNKNVKNNRIVEVGCGNGFFLRKLVEDEKFGNVGYGFDPSYVGITEDLSGRLRFQKRYYDDNCAEFPANIVICRHVIEHIPDPVNLLRTVKQALVNSPDARIFFETPCVEWIFRNQVIWDFFYEHCSYFTMESLKFAFETAGFKVEAVRHVFNGQYLWLEARLPKTNETIFTDKSFHNTKELHLLFATAEQTLKNKWVSQIKMMKSRGKVAVWGAGAKGVTFVNLIDRNNDNKLIDCVVDLNPNKQGHFIPGTGHPIVGYHELKERKVSSAILMNPNYREEILALLRNSQLEISLVG